MSDTYWVREDFVNLDGDCEGLPDLQVSKYHTKGQAKVCPHPNMTYNKQTY
jgi:hypothetical protein